MKEGKKNEGRVEEGKKKRKKSERNERRVEEGKKSGKRKERVKKGKRQTERERIDGCRQ